MCLLVIVLLAIYIISDLVMLSYLKNEKNVIFMVAIGREGPGMFFSFSNTLNTF